MISEVVYIQGRRGTTRLTDKETAVLRALRAGEIVPFGVVPGMSKWSATVHVANIRKKLSAIDSPTHIRSVQRQGWQLDEPETPCSASAKTYLAQRDALIEAQSQQLRALTEEITALRQRIEALETTAASYGRLVTP